MCTHVLTEYKGCGHKWYQNTSQCKAASNDDRAGDPWHGRELSQTLHIRHDGAVPSCPRGRHRTATRPTTSMCEMCKRALRLQRERSPVRGTSSLPSLPDANESRHSSPSSLEQPQATPSDTAGWPLVRVVGPRRAVLQRSAPTATSLEAVLEEAPNEEQNQGMGTRHLTGVLVPRVSH